MSYQGKLDTITLPNGDTHSVVNLLCCEATNVNPTSAGGTIKTVQTDIPTKYMDYGEDIVYALRFLDKLSSVSVTELVVNDFYGTDIVDYRVGIAVLSAPDVWDVNYLVGAYGSYRIHDGDTVLFKKATLSSYGTDYERYLVLGVFPKYSDIDYNSLINKPTLATVATTGAYADLSGTPDLSTKLDTTNPSGTGTLVMSAESTMSRVFAQTNATTQKNAYVGTRTGTDSSGNHKNAIYFRSTYDGTKNLTVTDGSANATQLIQVASDGTLSGEIPTLIDKATADYATTPQRPSLTGTDYANSGWESDDKIKCPNNTYKSVGSIEVPAGVWLIEFAVSFYKSSVGRRGIGFGTTKNDSSMGGTINKIMVGSAGSDEATTLSKTVIVFPSSTTRYFIHAYQNAGGELYVYPRFRAIRIKH